ncbi:response regulator [Haloarcula hispanica]|uniref:response regulator n=1 Tax=Haloarcula hispanica TaxID=51589 RepID=UPI0011B64239|nr:response regulator [Haloarcula hispanica]
MTSEEEWRLGDKIVELSSEAISGSRRATTRHTPLLRTESAAQHEEMQTEVPIPLAKVEQSQQCTVLHVDDDPQVGELVEVYLERINDDFDVVTKTSAVAALDFVRTEQVDCIVSDYDMPNTDGLEFLELIREQYPDIPFILFTGKGSEEIASEAIASGVTDYMQKGGRSDTYDVLANRIENAVEQHRTEQRFWNALSWYQRLVEQELAGVCIIQDGTFVYVNQKLADIFGYDQSELIDESPTILTPEGDESRFPGALRTAESDERDTFHSEFAGQQADGETRTIEVSGGSIEYDGEPAWIGVLRDAESNPDIGE